MAELATGLTVVVGSDPSFLTDDELCATVLGLEKLRQLVDTASMGLLAELDTRRATDLDHGMRTGPWLAREAQLPGPSGRARVKVANKLRAHLSGVFDAMTTGRIGWDHARVLSDAANPRIIDEFAEMVPELVNLVELMTFEAWSRHVRAVAEMLDQDGGHTPGDDITDNHLSVSGLWDNTVVLSGQLTGEFAITVRDAINARADRLFREMNNDAEVADDELPVPPRKTLQALALFELISDAIGQPAGGHSTPNAGVSLVINAQDPEHVTDTNGVPIGDTGRFACLCDPVFHPVVVDTRGVVLDLGRTQRLASDAQRQAMAHRDGGCVFPGCENPASWTDAHHTWHWTKGGPTDLSLLASLCRRHHMVTHRKGWSMHTTDDQWFWWETPKGQILWSQRYGMQRTAFEASRASRHRSPDDGRT